MPSRYRIKPDGMTDDPIRKIVPGTQPCRLQRVLSSARRPIRFVNFSKSWRNPSNELQRLRFASESRSLKRVRKESSKSLANGWTRHVEPKRYLRIAHAERRRFLPVLWPLCAICDCLLTPFAGSKPPARRSSHTEHTEQQMDGSAFLSCRRVSCMTVSYWRRSK